MLPSKPPLLCTKSLVERKSLNSPIYPFGLVLIPPWFHFLSLSILQLCIVSHSVIRFGFRIFPRTSLSLDLVKNTKSPMNPLFLHGLISKDEIGVKGLYRRQRVFILFRSWTFYLSTNLKSESCWVSSLVCQSLTSLDDLRS